MPKFHKLYRGICLALFAISGAYSLYNPHIIKTVALALIGVISYDIICYFKTKNDPKDHAPELEAIRIKLNETSQQVKEMKDDVSVAKLANSFRSR